ncbi:hypothetical protein J31TS4_22360 [Paenibacillus sp. J31TS4]|nr:hypothetical protein J31TS4_22360 [Paenibacillus sp. J31TS4]
MRRVAAPVALSPAAASCSLRSLGGGCPRFLLVLLLRTPVRLPNFLPAPVSIYLPNYVSSAAP